MEIVNPMYWNASLVAQVLSVIAVALNLLVVLVFATTKQFRVKYHGFVFNLVLADIAVSVTLFIYMRPHPFDKAVQAVGRAFFLTAQLNILAVAVNRLLALSLMPPARYDAVVTPARMVLACLLIWIVSAALFVPTTFLQDKKLNWLIQALLPLITLVMTGIFYVMVFRKIAHYRAPLAYTQGISDIEEQTSTRLRQTRHLMVTFTVIFVASALCWLPFCVVFIMLFAHGGPTISLSVALWWSFPPLTINSILNPFIYWWRFKEARDGFYQLLFGCCCRRRQETAEETEGDL
ncbi:histamine H2 receptor-like [Acanthaster planci]|uniref:Histamine H2 receptor-like n=1 Tax=Acanthaster planci TaxID=133434 RepID=A0A8B7YYS7_ACAPL|nr:histamine H2 receptor-like [Acanthaster planci]